MIYLQERQNALQQCFRNGNNNKEDKDPDDDSAEPQAEGQIVTDVFDE